jgi:hypothetical protein
MTVGISLILGKQDDFSEEENRSLQTLTATQIFNGEIFSHLNAFYSDQFPKRNKFLLLSSVINKLFDSNESNGIIMGKDGYLISRHDYPDLTVLDKNISSIKNFLEERSSAQILIAPRTVDVMRSKLPSLFPKDYGICEYEIIKRTLKEEQLINPIELFKRHADRGEYVYYKTDHHWTTLGAYRAYEQIAHRFDFSPYQQDHFDIQCVSAEFYGTTHSKSLLQKVSADEIYLYRYDGDEKTLIIFPNGSESEKKLSSFYDLSIINEDRKDKYKVFLSGNTDLLLIRDQAHDLPKLLLIKDSFANSVIPFLALHYDIDVIDLRYYKSSVKEYIDENEFDAVLLLYGMDTLATDISCSNILK